MYLKPLETMETRNLLLRPLRAEDAPMLFEQMLGDDDVIRDLPTIRHSIVQQTAVFIEQSMLGWAEGTLIRYVLECKATGMLTALIELKPALPRVEIGVIISRRGSGRRRRSGVLALQELIDWLIEQPGVYRIFACCCVDGAAQSSMERLGFIREALLKNYEPRPNRGLLAADSYLFSLTRPAPAAAPRDKGIAWLDATMRWSFNDA